MTNTSHNDLKMWASDMCRKNRETLDEIARNGNAIEKALVSKVIELAEVAI